VLANVWDYLDGQCSSELATRIERHVSACVICLRFTDFQRQLVASLADLRERWVAPRHVHDRVRTALIEARRERDGSSRE
jgi:hypothetical protein